MTAEIAEVKNLFIISDSKTSVGKQPTLSAHNFLFDNLCVLTPSLWSKGPPIAWTCSFHQMHPLIKDNSFQSQLGFRDLNRNSDLASFYSNKMSLIYFFFHKNLLVRNLQVAYSTCPEP